ncbi:hypothetical protein IFHNHDMJ_00397 [Synechococcus sp. CBW1107]|nr:hypothetical protein IFHNHDMJ_00397 [Synechococcus sp. CBW1107]
MEETVFPFKYIIYPQINPWHNYREPFWLDDSTAHESWLLR